jgi:hypothetical protein
MSVTIKTNHQWRELVYRYDVPDEILKSQFDYQDPENILDGFFKYRGYWYHIDSFMTVQRDAPSEFKDWSAYASDSYFSGVVIKFSKDCERIKVGTYFS